MARPMLGSRATYPSSPSTRAKDPSIMLRITYSPPGADPRIFELEDWDKDLLASEAELIEEAGGVQWGTFMHYALQMTNGSMRATRVLLWIMLRRENPDLELDDLDFPVSALSVEEFEDDKTTEPEGKDEAGDSATSSP